MVADKVGNSVERNRFVADGRLIRELVHFHKPQNLHEHCKQYELIFLLFEFIQKTLSENIDAKTLLVMQMCTQIHYKFIEMIKKIFFIFFTFY